VNPAMSPTTRRTLAVTILLTLIVLVWSTAVQPLIALVMNRQAAIASLADQVAGLEAVVGREPELQQRLRDGQRRLAVSGGLWAGSGAATIAAGVEDRLRAAVAAGGGQVTSTSEAHEAFEHGFRKITVHCTIEGTLDTMIKTLTAIETARPALFADNLTAAVQEAATGQKGPPILDIDLDVAGYSARPGS
jgi:general secretion pathway protein M